MWEMGEMRTVKVLEGYHRRAVTTVKFSPDGRLLATLGADDHHGLAVYDWENSVLLCTTRRVLYFSPQVRFENDHVRHFDSIDSVVCSSLFDIQRELWYFTIDSFDKTTT